MLFGKYINRYYLRYFPAFFLGVLALILVDYMQLVIPKLYRMTVNGMIDGAVEVEGTLLPFDMDFLLDRICLPMMIVILGIVFGRFLWRVCFRGSAPGLCSLSDEQGVSFSQIPPTYCADSHEQRCQKDYS